MREKDLSLQGEQGERLKPLMTVVVPSEGIRETGNIDYMFMITADVPRKLCSGRPYGLLRRVEKDSNHVNPFKLARGEEGAIGDDGVLIWQLNLGEAGRQVFGGMVDADEAGAGLADLLSEMPDCVVMVPPTDIEALEHAQAARLEVVTYEGTLHTSS